MTPRTRRDLRPIAAIATLLTALLPAKSPTSADVGARLVGDVDARGAFTCDFGLGPEAFSGNLPAVVERDRMYMAARPGMLHKHIPFRPDATAAAGGALAFSGGRYLFDTVEHARAYAEFVMHAFTSTASSSSPAATSSIPIATHGK